MLLYPLSLLLYLLSLLHYPLLCSLTPLFTPLPALFALLTPLPLSFSSRLFYHCSTLVMFGTNCGITHLQQLGAWNPNPRHHRRQKYLFFKNIMRCLYSLFFIFFDSGKFTVLNTFVFRLHYTIRKREQKYDISSYIFWERLFVLNNLKEKRFNSFLKM